MHRSLLAIGCLFTACHAQTFLLPGTVYSDINGACPIPENGTSYAVDMIIWPSNGIENDPDAQETARANIAQYFDNKGPALTLTNYTSQLNGLRSWFINMTNADACGVAALAGVDSVMVDGEDPDQEQDAPFPSPTPVLEERAATLATQTSAVTELRIMSQPTTVPDISKLPNYVFQEDPGSGITIYLIDSGVNTSPFSGRLNTNDILVAPKALPGSQDDSTNGHSTCAADKAAGLRYGVAKAATIIPAKKSTWIRDSYIIFDLVRQDIVNRSLQKKAVVSFSFGNVPTSTGVIPQYWIEASNYMKSIMNDLDVPMVNSAGNDAVTRSQTIDKYPKIFQTDDFPLINVGATTSAGDRASFSQDGNLLTVSSPGVGITCTNPTGTGTQTTQGTSFAAPQVSGLLAYFLGLGTVPFDTTTGNLALAALNYLKTDASWVRSSTAGAPNVAWNLIDDTQNPPT